ncbi:MAG: ABC transporter ATP-binding protein [Candidatus Uhrbacteria bacterium]|nr:ABC transporter ATP-binding protein [Candidatus Uhrbacteria bacterium]
MTLNNKIQTIKTREIFKVLWQHVMRYRTMVTVLFIATVAANILDLVTPIFYKRFFDVLAQSSLAPNDSRVTILIGILVSILTITLINWACSRVSAYINVYLEPRVMVDLERTSFHHLLRHSYQFFTDNFAGSLVRRIHRLSRAFEEIFDILKESFLAIFITVIGMIIVVYQRSPVIAGIIFGWTLFFIIINYSFARWKLKYDLARAAKDSESTGLLSDALTNSVNINLFNGHAFEDGLFAKVTGELRRLRVFGWSLGEGSNSFQMIMMIGIEFAVMYAAIHFWQRGLLTIGDFALLQSYLIFLFGKLGDFRRIIRHLYESLADATEMVEILNMPHEIQDAKNAKHLTVTKGAIEFEHVTFSYHQTRTVLRDFTLKIKPREKVALVGPSGAGKSTVVKILLRFYDLDRGKILIDGQTVARITQDSLHECFALVPQEPLLFHRTLMDNIRYGKRDAGDEEVIEAAKKARCHEFIESSPQGYETYVGERGIKLSGGERQRIAIARAILKNAPILVLDEATSSLDSESESLIQDALHELMKNKTVIVIAHRLSTIMEMDRIVVMENGRVIDTGTHDTLLKKGGLYQKLWEIQAGGFLP